MMQLLKQSTRLFQSKRITANSFQTLVPRLNFITSQSSSTSSVLHTSSATKNETTNTPNHSLRFDPAPSVQKKASLTKAQRRRFELAQQQTILFSADEENNVNDIPDESYQNSNNNSSSNNNNNNKPNGNNDNEDSQLKASSVLKTIPFRNWKDTELTAEEKRITPRTHILFSSQQPILPFSKKQSILKMGNLTRIEHELAFFTLSETGDIYQVGLELEKTVTKQLSKQFDKSTGTTTTTTSTASTEESAATATATSSEKVTADEVQIDLAPKKLAHRLKIVEVEITPTGIFAKTIPFRDRPVNKALAKFNLEKELLLLRSLVQSIKKQIAYEKIEVFGPLEIESTTLSDLTHDQIDRALFSVIDGLTTLYKKYMKESTNILTQCMLESRSVAERVLLLRISLEELNSVMDIVSRKFKLADDNLIRMQTQARAKLSMEYIRQTYFQNEKSQMGGFFGGQMHGSGGAAGAGNTQMQKLIQGYLSKLHLIDDLPSQERVKQEIERFSQIDKNSSEFNKINTYLDEVFNVPWNKFTPANWDIQYAKKVLDEEIYGLEKVKQRIIEMIAVNQIKNTHSKSKGFVLLLQGPPGTGKTSIAKAIAKSLQKESRFISFAGISDPSFFKGHRRTYVDSQPGVFIKEMIKAQTMNPVLVLDEIDKISRSSMGADPYYSLMEILNPDENHNFTDHYLDVKVDFSNTIFILTANNIINMLEPLKNRLEIIDIPAYIEEEKLQICKKYIIPKAIKSNGINENLLRYNNDTISQIIKNWCYDEAGMRGLKRCFETISRKFAVELLSTNPELVKLQQLSHEEAIQSQNEKQQEPSKSTGTQANAATTKKAEEFPTILSDQTIQTLNLPVLDLTQSKNSMDTLKKYLGVPSFDSALDSRQTLKFEPGVVNIMSVGGFVGHIMKIECVFDNSQLSDKKGNFASSGNLQTVLQESLTIAKINAFNILTEEAKKVLATRNVHIHFMSGAIPKDGPSAGIAICTAYLSLAMGKSVPASIAMTGELSPIGEVCKIGGLQAKIIAAKTLHINEIICPYANIGDAQDFPNLLLEGLTIYFVREYSQVYSLVFEDGRNSLPAGVVVLKNGVYSNTQQQQISIQQSNVTASPLHHTRPESYPTSNIERTTAQ